MMKYLLTGFYDMISEGCGCRAKNDRLVNNFNHKIIKTLQIKYM